MSDERFLTKPRLETRRRTIKKLIKPARLEKRETGRIVRREIRTPGAKDFTVEEVAETENVFFDAEYQEQEDVRPVFVVETVPLGKAQRALLKEGDVLVTEKHEFANEKDAHAFYAARQRQGK